jgi:hypothetical protein
MSDTHWVEVKRGKGKYKSAPPAPAPKRLNLNDASIQIKGDGSEKEGKHFFIGSEHVHGTIEWSRGQHSPVTHQPCHPGRHDGEKKSKDSNYFGLFKDCNDSHRPLHSVMQDSFPDFVQATLASRLGQQSLKWLYEQSARKPQRLVFSVPQIAQEMKGVFFDHGDIVGQGKSEGGILVVDGDRQGNLYIVTGYNTDSMPPDVGTKAGGFDCCYTKGNETLLIYDPEKEEIRCEVVGGTTLSTGEDGERTMTTRMPNQPTKYQKKD